MKSSVAISLVAASAYALQNTSQVDADSGKRVQVGYSDDKAAIGFNGSSTCTDTEIGQLQHSINTMKPYVLRALKKTNDAYNPATGKVEGEKTYTKWFGVPTEANTDEDVIGRMTDATEWLDEMKYESRMAVKGDAGKWTPLCCRGAQGACSGCAGGTMAYVQSYPGEISKVNDVEFQDKVSLTNIHLCETVMEMGPHELGATLYHELIHMRSVATDIGYAKIDGIKSARDTPDIARTTANNFELYMNQNSMTYNEYEKYTHTAGMSVSDTMCTDAHRGCHQELVLGNKCCIPFTPDGDRQLHECCRSCAHVNQLERCSDAAALAVMCQNKYDSCKETVKTFRCNQPSPYLADQAKPNVPLLEQSCCAACTRAAPQCLDFVLPETCASLTPHQCIESSWDDGSRVDLGCCKTCTAKVKDFYSNCAEMASKECAEYGMTKEQCEDICGKSMKAKFLGVLVVP